MKKLTVVIVDDHPLIHEAVRSLLAEQEQIQLVGEGYSGDDLFPLLDECQPNVLILDLGMPQRSSDPSVRFAYTSALPRLNEEYPGTAVIILSQYLHRTVVKEAVEHGVKGYLLKTDNLSLNLTEAITAVSRNGVFFSHEFSKELFGSEPVRSEKNVLTSRQREVILAIAKDPEASYAQLADRLSISESTFKGHLRKVYAELEVGNSTSLVIRCLELGLIPYTIPENGKGLEFGDLEEPLSVP